MSPHGPVRAGPGRAGQQACAALPGHLCPSDSAFKGRLREPAREPSSGSDASPHVHERPRTSPHVRAIGSCELGHGDTRDRHGLQEQRPGLTQTRPGSAAGTRAATRISGARRLRAKLARAAGRRSHSRWASRTVAPPPRLPPQPFSRGAGQRSWEPVPKYARSGEQQQQACSGIAAATGGPGMAATAARSSRRAPTARQHAD
jgi:hypothetical protein